MHMTDTHTINMIYTARNCKGELTALEYSLPKVPAASRAELDFTGVFAIHGIHQQITLKEGKSIIWSRDKLKARQPRIDPVCAGVCGIQQITWGEQGRRKLLWEGGSGQGLTLGTDRNRRKGLGRRMGKAGEHFAPGIPHHPRPQRGL